MASWTTEYFGAEIETKNGKKSTTEALANKKLIAIYFSAHWCPPCRGFTPVLTEFYNSVKEEDENALEIIFVSSDRDAGSFNEYWGSMSFVALPFDNRAGKEKLAEKFGVSGIPTFVVLDGATGAIKDGNARNTVTAAKGNVKSALAQWTA